MLKAKINSDLKAAMLSGDKQLVEILRSLKSAILYKEVADNKRDEGLSDEEILSVLKKEKKSRGDALEMYISANETERADKESYQISMIEKYLPENVSEEDTKKMVEEVMITLSIDKVEMKHMGQIMSEIKKRNAAVEGAVVSKVIKGMM